MTGGQQGRPDRPSRASGRSAAGEHGAARPAEPAAGARAAKGTAGRPGRPGAAGSARRRPGGGARRRAGGGHDDLVAGLQPARDDRRRVAGHARQHGLGAAAPASHHGDRGAAQRRGRHREARRLGGDDGFTALDNGFAAVDDVAAVQAICDSFDEQVIWDLAAKWMALLPCPFTADDTAAGYRYEVSVVQAEFSLTQVLDAPVTGRIFFEQVIRDNLDIGRPDQVGLIFGRRIIRKGPRATPGRFRTRVITEGVVPTLHVDYKHSKIKQYHKEGKALRTETTINDSRDFGIGKRLDNLPALRAAGFAATRRLLDVEKLSHDPADGQAAITQITRPVITQTGTRVAGLRLGDPRVHALLAALCVFRLLPRGFANRDLRPILAQLLGVPAESITPGKMTYDLRACASTGSSNASRTPSATRSPIPASPGPCSSPGCTTGSCAPDWPASPDPQTAAGTWPPPPAPTPRAVNDLTRQAGLAA